MQSKKDMQSEEKYDGITGDWYVLIVRLVVIRHLNNKFFFVQMLVRFFHADGEGLLLEDLKSGDYKVFSPLTNVAGQMH